MKSYTLDQAMKPKGHVSILKLLMNLGKMLKTLEVLKTILAYLPSMEKPNMPYGI